MPDVPSEAVPAGLLHRVQQLQRLSHPASTVTRPCRRVAGSLTPRAVAPPPGDDLDRFADLAYGYRTTPRGVARHAASAGAMYPVETVWLAGGPEGWRWRLHVPERRGCVDVGDATAAATALGLRTGQWAVAVVAVAWRTVQRYGVRGYRYCLLDAGNVLGNIAALAVHAGTAARLPDRMPHDVVHADLGLTADELLLAVVVLDAEAAAAAPTGPSPTVDGLGTGWVVEHPPLLNPALHRVRRLHGFAEPAVQPAVDLAELVRVPGADAPGEIRRRHSARAFTGTPMPSGVAPAIEALQLRLAAAVRPPLRDWLALRYVAPAGEGWRSRWWDPSTGTWRAAEVPAPSPTCRIRMFGQQPIAGAASAFLLVGMTPDRSDTGLSVYRRLLLVAGLVCAEAYRMAVRLGCATTVLGGFDDEAVAALGGGGFTPLVAQAIGVPEPAADLKNDTVAAGWLSTS
ncbi:hypothetical protein [Micromonospora sp. WMMD1082]|uniref:hypothetical protein n=1 Tax=Micromonospora sp. WMMD1082 TaxID=3016104 RepID=UPI0024176927|nr:hypothetical protein [Micromonospora sp. WMMD1082]MDG4794544.1 hypothetical protein [Micromonospora sp. WMMD1082]